MLVNASRFTSVQAEIRASTCHDYLATLVHRIRFGGGYDSAAAMTDEHIKALHCTWREQFARLAHSWDEIVPKLLEAAAPISVVEINSRSPGALDYDAYKVDGRQVIAVGGFSLSRGLTLEGLTVSYFLRNSIMYDTLMQMGRWFGYRPEYEDLCRIWMTPDAAGWYEHIADSIEELRESSVRWSRLV